MNSAKLAELLQPSVEALGYILWGLEYLPQGKHSVLRLYIDKEDGILLEDCEAVSRQVGQILDVEDPIKSNYTLEVSSPGLDRPLFEMWHYQKYVGSEVMLKLHQAINKQKKLSGIIEKTAEQEIEFKVGDERLTIPLDMISKANIVS